MAVIAVLEVEQTICATSEEAETLTYASMYGEGVRRMVVSVLDAHCQHTNPVERARCSPAYDHVIVRPEVSTTQLHHVVFERQPERPHVEHNQDFIHRIGCSFSAR